MGGLSRRAFLLGGAGAVTAAAGGLALVQADVLPGRIPLDTALGRCGGEPPEPTAEAPAPQVSSFRSAARGRDVRYVIARPPGDAAVPLPLCLVLHGRGGDASTAFDALLWHRHLAEAVTGGAPPYALVGVDGGEAYWHPRAGGDDPQRMLIEELLPRLTDAGLRTDRFAVAGWSMGAYGSLLLARKLGPARVPVVATLSAALWPSYDDTAAGAFDSADDFAAHDVLARPDALRGVAVRIRCGRSDPFAGTNRQLLRDLEAEGGLTEGCHDLAYWRREATPMLDWIGHNL